jgi:hypothetical protein
MQVSTAVTLYVLVGFQVLTAAVMRSSVSWDIMQCSVLKMNRRFGGALWKMEKICSSETSADFQRDARRYIFCIVAYLFKVRTVGTEKQPSLENAQTQQ